MRQTILLLAAVCAVFLLAPAGAKDDASAEPVPEFTDAMLNDAQRQAAGKQIWQQQCRHCHGRSAYPGKAPKLKPRRYQPDFVYDRITNGFRKMPAWKEAYSQQERINLVAFIMGDNFSP